MRESISQTIDAYDEETDNVESVKELRKHILEKHGQDTKPWQLRSIMREDLRMRYKRINDIAWTGNDPRNIILRQHFALEYMKIDFDKKIIINTDETWIAMSDFRRMKWMAKGTTNSLAVLGLVPRISMIVGLDNHG